MRRFLDTNVLVYADDKDAGAKQETAQAILRDVMSDGSGAVSTQVLQEFFVITTRKLGVDPVAARRKIELLSRIDVVRVDTASILAAIDLHRLHSFSFWDGLIVRAAQLAGCELLLSEDLQHGRVIDGIRIENPFR
jgi:predicted nucleic acid-binding protein